MAPSNRRVGPPRPPRRPIEDDFPDGNDGVEALVDKEPAPLSPSGIGVWIRAVAGLVMVIGVSTAVAAVARRYVVTSPRFVITTIDIDGIHHLKPEEIMQLAGLARGANIFLADLNDGRAKLLTNPWIRDAALARRLPGTLLVDIKEREAAAIVAVGETYLASREGEMFKRLETNDPSDLPVITGIAPDAVNDDRQGVTDSVRRALDLANDYEHSALVSRGPLQEIHLASDGTTTLVVGKSVLMLSLGLPPFRKKLEQAARIMAELDARGARAQVLFLDNEARPERVVVRVR